MEKFDAFILIGGRSSRFGSDKALAEIDGRSLARRAADTVRAALPGATITMVAGNEPQFAIEAIQSGTGFIFDLYPNRGPLGGLHAALAHAQAPWIFLMACDFPLMPAELITLLGTKVSDEYDAVVPQQPDGRLQPLCAFYNVGKCRTIVDATLDRPRSASMHEVLDQLQVQIVTSDTYGSVSGAGDAFINVNRPQDIDLVAGPGLNAGKRR